MFDGKPFAFERLSTDLYLGHMALRRNLDTIIGVTERGDSADAVFLEFVELYLDLLLAHHRGEDDTLFPALRRHSTGRSADVAFLEARRAERRSPDLRRGQKKALSRVSVPQSTP